MVTENPVPESIMYPALSEDSIVKVAVGSVDLGFRIPPTLNF